MRILTPKTNLDSFFKKLKETPNRLLMLDYDGTLAPFVVDPAKASPYPEIEPVLGSLAQLQSCRTVVISGRAVDDLLPLMGMEHPPEIWGSHGLERRRSDGTYEIAEIDKGDLELLEEVSSWSENQKWTTRIERKPAGVGLHWRGNDPHDIDDAKKRIMSHWSDRLRGTGIDMHEFDGGIEFRVRGMNKGQAVKTLLQETGKPYLAAYLGDDATDEDAFAALGSNGLSVLVRPKWRETNADLWLTPPGELLEFLTHWTEALRALS
jgi:trehalose 6-phosphate phosphatase